jgi:hypothetical protein
MTKKEAEETLGAIISKHRNEIITGPANPVLRRLRKYIDDQIDHNGCEISIDEKEIIISLKLNIRVYEFVYTLPDKFIPAQGRFDRLLDED